MTQDTDCTKLISGRDCLQRHDPRPCRSCFAYAEMTGTIFAAEVLSEQQYIIEQLRREHVIAYRMDSIESEGGLN